MSKLTVCVIAQEPSKTVRLHQVVKTLRKLDYNVVVLMPRFHMRFKPRILSAALRYLGIMLQVLFADADVYIVFNNPDVGFPVLLKRGKFIYDVRNPWGAEVYDSTGNELAARICEITEHILTISADLVTAVNHKLAARARKWGAKRVLLVPNYPMASFEPTLTRDEMRDTYELKEKKVALFAGNFAEVECAFDLAELFPKVLEKVSNGVLVMIGDGPQKQAIENYVERHGLKASIRILNRIPRKEVPNWLAAADLVLVPRKADMRSSPFYCPESIWKVTEALRIGTPIVAGAIGGFIGTKFPIKVVPLENFPETIVDIFRNPHKTRPLKEISWGYSEEKLKDAFEGLA